MSKELTYSISSEVRLDIFGTAEIRLCPNFLKKKTCIIKLNIKFIATYVYSLLGDSYITYIYM